MRYIFRYAEKITIAYRFIQDVLLIYRFYKGMLLIRILGAQLPWVSSVMGIEGALCKCRGVSTIGTDLKNGMGVFNNYFFHCIRAVSPPETAYLRSARAIAHPLMYNNIPGCP